MPRMKNTDTTVDCPSCGGEIEVSFEVTYTPAERATHDYPGCDADMGVFARVKPCAECGDTLSCAEIQKIEEAYEPPNRDDFADEDTGQ